MIYLKSLLAGVGALVAFYFLFVTVAIRLLLPKPPDLQRLTAKAFQRLWVSRQFVG
jgi:hypothetical protein